MQKLVNVEFVKAALTRAVKTMAQTAVSLMTIGQAVTAMDWKNIVTISVGAGVMSILTSIATGIPGTETPTDGKILIDNSGDREVLRLALNEPTDYYQNKKSLTLELDAKSILEKK